MERRLGKATLRRAMLDPALDWISFFLRSEQILPRDLQELVVYPDQELDSLFRRNAAGAPSVEAVKVERLGLVKWAAGQTQAVPAAATVDARGPAKPLAAG